MNRIRSLVLPVIVVVFAVFYRPEAAISQESPSTEADDVMQPTRNGFRLTPQFTDMFARRWLSKEVGQRVKLSESQQDMLTRKLSDRLMDMADNNGEKVRDFFEYAVESMIATRGQRPNAEMGQELAKRAGNVLPLVQDLYKSFARDARPVLDDEQWGQFKDYLRRDFERINRLSTTMDRWSKGDIKEGDRPLLDMKDEGEPPPIRGMSKRRGPSPPMRRARMTADIDMKQVDTSEWAAYLKSAAAFFKFTPEQMAEGKKILDHYRGEANKIITPDWIERCRQNRIKYSLRWSLGREPVRPWVYHLEREFEDMVAPVKELERQYHQAVLALATNEQRAAAVAVLRERAEKHGMAFDENDIVSLGLGVK